VRGAVLGAGKGRRAANGKRFVTKDLRVAAL